MACLFIDPGTIREEDFYLMVLRDDKPGILNPGKWSIPGGHIDPGETPYEAICREMVEELEIDPSRVHYLEIGEFPDDKGTCTLYTANEHRPVEDIPLNEGQQLGWFTLEAALELDLSPWLRQILEDWGP